MIEGGRCAASRPRPGSASGGEAVVSTIHVKHLLDMAPADAWTRIPLGRRDLRHRPVGVRRLPRDDRAARVRDRRRAAQRGSAGLAASRATSSTTGASARRPLRRGRRMAAGRHARRSSTPRARPRATHGQVPSARRRVPGVEGGAGRSASSSASACAGLRRRLARLVKTPEDIEAQQPAHDPRHLPRRRPHHPQSGGLRPAPGWATHRMPIPGLYQTGGTTHPGGSITGAPGRNAAMVLCRPRT